MTDKTLTVDEAARRIGAKRGEVVDVLDSPAGPVIAHRDGTRLIVVADDQPDAEGKTGLMFLANPHPHASKGGTVDFPIYAPHAEDDAAAEDEAESYDDLNVKALQALLDERGLDSKGVKAELVARLQEDDAAAAEDEAARVAAEAAAAAGA